MPKIQFIGRVLPEAIKVSVPPRDAHWQNPNTGLDTTMRIRIQMSIINIEVESNVYDPSQLSPVYTKALDFASASVNLVAFSAGTGHLVTLDTVIGEDGIPLPLVLQNPSLSSLCTVLQLTPERAAEFTEIYDMILGEEQFFVALNDLISGIALPHVAPISCGRAMDGLKNLIATPGSRPPRAWQQMREALQISEPYLKFITDRSAGPRHAHLDSLSLEIRDEICRRSWVIMNRYIEYRKRKTGTLPLSEFPLLIQ